jgi:hypothetical protein
MQLTLEQKGELWQLSHTYCFVWSDQRYEKNKMKEIFGPLLDFSLENNINFEPLIHNNTNLVKRILQNNQTLLQEFFLFYIMQICMESDPQREFAENVYNKAIEYYWRNVCPAGLNNPEYIDQVNNRLIADMASDRITINFVFKS